MSNNNLIPSLGVDLTPTETQKLLYDYEEDKDFDLVEDNIKKYLESMDTHVGTLGKIADQSQEARAYEVLHNFYKVMLEGNRELMDIKKKKADILAAEQIRKNPTGQITNNNLFVGSTADLQRFLQKKENENG